MSKKPLRDQLAYQKRLHEITHRIHAAPNTREILLTLQEQILSILGAERITIYTVDAPREELVSLVKTGDEVQEIRIPIARTSIAGYCAFEKKAVNVPDAYDEESLKGIIPPMAFDRSWDRRTGYRTRQVLAVPVMHEGILLGVIQLINKTNHRPFTNEDLAAVEDMARVLAVAFLKNLKVRQALGSRFGYLVLHNRLSQGDLLEAMSRARKTGRPLETILMEDLRIPKEEIGRALSHFHNVPFLKEPPEGGVDRTLLRGLRPGFLKASGFVPVSRSGDTITVAMEDPDHLPSQDALRSALPGCKTRICVCLRGDLHRMIDQTFLRPGPARPTDTGGLRRLIHRLEVSEDKTEEPEEGISEVDSAVVQLVS